MVMRENDSSSLGTLASVRQDQEGAVTSSQNMDVFSQLDDVFDCDRNSKIEKKDSCFQKLFDHGGAHAPRIDRGKLFGEWIANHQGAELIPISNGFESAAIKLAESSAVIGRAVLKPQRSYLDQLFVKFGLKQEDDPCDLEDNNWDDVTCGANGIKGAHVPIVQNGHSNGTISDCRDVSFVPVLPVRDSRLPEAVRDGGTWETFQYQKELVMKLRAPGTLVHSLSRSSSGSVTESPVAASIVESPMEPSCSGTAHIRSGGSMNFLQAGEEFQLQLALALRVTAEAAAVDDSDLLVTRVQGSSKVVRQATTHRYWLSNCLGYDDQIEDGFYDVSGMSPHIWAMCTDGKELGAMPPLEALQNVHPSEAGFEVVLVDRNTDSALKRLEDEAVGLAYESTEVLDMASKLSIMVANVMGGPVASEKELLESWQVVRCKLMQLLKSVVLPIGVLRVGLGRHRALLFKVMCDSVGLPCRLVRGNPYCGREDAMCVVKCGNDREWMVDLLEQPGTIMPPDARLSLFHAVISSPLQLLRESPFAEMSLVEWNRCEFGNIDTAGKRGCAIQVSGNEGFAHCHKLATLAEKSSSEGVSRQVQPLNLNGTVVDEDAQSNPSISNRNSQKGRSPIPSEGIGQQESSLINVRGHKGGSKGEKRQATGLEGLSWNKHGGLALGRLVPNERDDEISWDDVILGDAIGQGSFGKVYRADWQGSDVAVKVFLNQDLKVEALEEFKTEVAIMRRLRHPNVVLFMGAVTKPPNLSIVTEFCPRGSLYRILHKLNRDLDERRRIHIALDVVKGMNYLHRCSPPVVHRDLKSANLLVDKNWTVKVCDFGLSRQKHSAYLSSRSSGGTPEWMAPEVLRNEPSDEKSDVYSFGVILWELSTLQIPWNGMSPIQVIGTVGFQQRRLQVPDTVDPGLAAIIQACWSSEPKLRPSFADLMLELKKLQKPNPAQGTHIHAELYMQKK